MSFFKPVLFSYPAKLDSSPLIQRCIVSQTLLLHLPEEDYQKFS